MKIKPLIQERILSVPYEVRTLPCASPHEIQIEPGLFGCDLHMRRQTVQCRSETEARYLAAFARMGFFEVPVPVDPALVEAVVDNLESEVTRITRFIEERSSVVLSPDRRRQVIEMVWEGVRKKIGLVLSPSQDDDEESDEDESGEPASAETTDPAL